MQKSMNALEAVDLIRAKMSRTQADYAIEERLAKYLAADHQIAMQEHRKMKDEVYRAEQELKNKQQQLYQIQMQLDQQQRNTDNFGKSLAERKNEKKDVQLLVERYKEQGYIALGNLYRFKQAIAELERKVNELRKKKAELEEGISGMKYEIGKLTRETREMHTQNESMKAQLEVLRDKLLE